MRLHRFVIALAGAPILLLGSGCGNTPESEFYMLSPMSQSAAPSAASSKGEPVSVGVGPAKIPDYLNRPNLVTRSTPNRLQLDEFHRWGGSLSGNLLRVVAQNLSVLLGTDNVVIYPSDDPAVPEYRVLLSIRRFDGSLGGTVVLDARWVVVVTDHRESMHGGRSLIRETTGSADHEALVVAQSRALEAMSREIAAEITRLINAAN